jgi:hypothetical protein
MQFWRIEPLKSQLRSGSLPAIHSLRYLVACLLTYSLCAELASRVPATGAAYEAVTSGIAYGLLLIGTLAAYRANGGGSGADFIARYLSLSWVLGIRITVIGGLLFVVFALILGVILVIVAPSAVESEAMWGWLGVPLVLIWCGAFYYRLYWHLRDINGLTPQSSASSAS